MKNVTNQIKSLVRIYDDDYVLKTPDNNSVVIASRTTKTKLPIFTNDHIGFVYYLSPPKNSDYPWGYVRLSIRQIN
jgi:hypothetical protein